MFFVLYPTNSIYSRLSLSAAWAIGFHKIQNDPDMMTKFIFETINSMYFLLHLPKFTNVNLTIQMIYAIYI